MYNAFKRLSKHYTPTERTQMFHDTAVRIYRVPV
jgi:predicted TIM-barrel fold metal-dependent hydrolase